MFTLEGLKTESIPNPAHPNWEKDPVVAKSKLTFQDKAPLSADSWKTYVFQFKAEKSGQVDFQVGGGFAQKEGDRMWVYARNIMVNDVSYKDNGDFHKIVEVKNQNNKRMPLHYWLGKKAQLADDVDGKPAVLVNHDNRLSFRLNVVEGEIYDVSVEMKAAPKP